MCEWMFKPPLEPVAHDKPTGRNVNRRWFDVLQFSTMLNLCQHTGLIALEENDCRTLRNIRNCVMHEVKLLIEAPEDITLVMKARTLCEQMICSVA